MVQLWWLVWPLWAAHHFRIRGPPTNPAQMGWLANRQSRVFSERGQLTQTIPQFHVQRTVTWMNANPAIRIPAKRTQGLWNSLLCFWGRDDYQWALVIRIVTIALVSDSAITIARFCPSKQPCILSHNFEQSKSTIKNASVFWGFFANTSLLMFLATKANNNLRQFWQLAEKHRFIAPLKLD